MLIHHVMCIAGMYLCLISDYSLNYVIRATFVLEFSNPVMHARMIIKNFGLRYTKLYEVLEISYILMYIYGRIIMGTRVVIDTLTCSQNNLVCKLVTVGIAF